MSIDGGMKAKIRRELARVGRLVEAAWKRHEKEPSYGDHPFICPGVGMPGRCTDVSVYLAERLGGQVYGYSIEDNPDAQIGALEGGHDFAIVGDGRYLVDFWARDTYQYPDLHDMKDPAQMEEVRRLYGDPERWTRMSEKSFQYWKQDIKRT